MCISIILCALINTMSCKNQDRAWIRINQLGYRNEDIKVAVLLSERTLNLKSYKIIDIKSGNVVMTFDNAVKSEPLDQFLSCYRLSFF